jgi:hypothetical protein
LFFSTKEQRIRWAFHERPDEYEARKIHNTRKISASVSNFFYKGKPRQEDLSTTVDDDQSWWEEQLLTAEQWSAILNRCHLHEKEAASKIMHSTPKLQPEHFLNDDTKANVEMHNLLAICIRDRDLIVSLAAKMMVLCVIVIWNLYFNLYAAVGVVIIMASIRRGVRNGLQQNKWLL